MALASTFALARAAPGPAVEALLAATYLDLGLESAERLGAQIAEHGLVQRETHTLDPKSELQNAYQARGERAPSYEVLSQDGPAHETVFEVVVRARGQEIGRGLGRSKKMAERNAALSALATDAESKVDEGEGKAV
jgi:ribonuclease III